MRIKTYEHNDDVVYSSGLEPGDFVPFFVIENGRRLLDIQVKASRYNLLAFIDHHHTDAIERAIAHRPDCNYFMITSTAVAQRDVRLFHDEQVFERFYQPGTVVTLCLADTNLKIRALVGGASFAEALALLPDEAFTSRSNLPPPVLLVPDVISDDLSSRLVAYLDQRAPDACRNRTGAKSRSHIHPDRALRRELDDKLSRSLLPEIEKVFYSEISHRETYKICCYDAAHSGWFKRHRDTIDPFLHRRYALTLVLNDDFEGGGISFPEYSDSLVVVPKNGAVVFPGSLYHEVNRIGQGRRYALVSFLFTEAEARVKEGSERYRFTVQRDLRGLKINKLTPDQ